MILEPINSITSIEFYKKVAQRSPGRTILYLAYLSALYAIGSAVWLNLYSMPLQMKTVEWLADKVPTLTFADGRLSSAAKEPVTLRHPDFTQVAFTLDTGRAEPVTPEMLRDSKVTAYVTANAMYTLNPKGQMEAHDFSKARTVKPQVIDAARWRAMGQTMSTVEYPVALCGCWLVYFFWKLAAAAFFSLVALSINRSAGAGLSYRALFSISAYAQTLALALTLIAMLASGLPPLLHLLNGNANVIALSVTTIYIWLAVRKNAPPPPQPVS